MKKIIIFIMISVLTVFLTFNSKKEKNDTNVYSPISYDSSVLNTTTDTNTGYSGFLKTQEQVYPSAEYVADLSNFDYKNGLFEDDQPKIETYIDEKNVQMVGTYVPETGDLTFYVEVDEAGLYNININYFNVEGRGSTIIRGIKINDEYQFSESENINFLRFWRDERIVSDNREKGKNDIRPSQLEVYLWENTYVHDHMGYYNDPFYFRFEQGVNSITFVSHREPIVLNSLTLTQATKLSNYDEYIRNLKNQGINEVDNTFNEVYEAEEAYLKSSSSLTPIAEYSTYKFSPYERQVTRYNAIGGVNWRIPGDEISWLINVPEEGLYNLTFTVMQNFSRGQNVSRTLKVNGQIPFEEARNIDFKYKSDLQNITLDNYIHLNKGDNIITLKSTVGIYGNAVQKVNEEIKNLRSLYREVVMRTGLNPNPVGDYMLVRNIKDLNERFEEIYNSFESIKEEIITISNGRNSLVSAFDRINYQIEKFIKDEKNIQNGLGEWEQNISNLGSWVMNVSEQPLTIDTITVHGNQHNLKRVSTNFFERIWHEIILFIESFKNTGDFGSTVEVEGPTIEVWIGTGRDQATIIRQLIDDTFVEEHNINVQLKMVNMGVLLSATLSGNGPDIAIGIDQKTPVNWGVRNAIKDLSQFDDFGEVVSRFNQSALTPLQYDGKTYGLPDTEDFLVMFYRKDILEEIGISEEQIPKTWEDIIDISPALQKQYFDFYIPILQGELSPVLHSMIIQEQGNLFINNGAESGLMEQGSLNAFLNFTRFFTDYGFVLEANFINRFRSGEMPIGISNYTTYNSLAVFAPEINGQWDYGYFPGTIGDDNVLRNQTTSSVTASVILEHTKETDASWEFLKWWLDADTQVAYARGMEAVLGSAARYPTANLEAFEQLPWPSKDYVLLKTQRENSVGIPTVPGDYIVGRYIDNAFRQTLNNNVMPQDSIYQYYLKINEELTRKRKELGLQ